jgi:hypothetical protein
VRWSPKQPPIVLEHRSVVVDINKFIITTLSELRARLEGKDWLATGASAI